MLKQLDKYTSPYNEATEPSTLEHSEQLIQRIMNLLRSKGNEALLEVTLNEFYKSPQFNRLQAYSNQSIRLLDNMALRYLYVSESVFEQSGYTKQEFAEGGLWFTYRKVHPKDLLKLFQMLLRVKQALKKLTPEEKVTARLEFDVRFKTKNKGYRRMLQSVHILSLSADGKPYLLLFSTTDITSYKRGNSLNYLLGVNRAGQGFVPVLTGAEHEDTPISKRELEVLQLVAQGLPEQEIADKLFLSVQTVKTHRKNMLQKADARNTADLVRMAIANGWL